MRKRVILVFLACWMPAAAGVARAQTLNQEMAGLADKISKALVAQGYKSVAAVDFTDLQGQPTELGRFLSERLVVEIVSSGGVSMVDRANIKSILAEHKLTEEGLVNPANAKKLGEFAGVDAILIGNATALDSGIELLVKAVATESSKLVAAGRITFQKTADIQQLLNRGISSTSGFPATATAVRGGNGTGYQEANAIATKDIGPLRIVLKSVLPMKLPGQKQGIRCSIEFTSRETQNPITVAMNTAVGNGTQIGNILRTTLVDDRGTVWRLYGSNIAGIGVVGVGRKGANLIFDNKGLYDPTEIAALLKRQDDTNSNSAIDRWAGNATPYQFIFGSMTPISAGGSVRVTMDFVQLDANSPSGPSPKFFQISTEFAVGVVTTGSTKSYSLQNLIFDRVSMPAF